MIRRRWCAPPPPTLKAAADEYRLVRVRAAAGLVAIKPEMIGDEHRNDVARATGELMDAMTARPDSYTSAYNLANFHMARAEYPQAIDSFRKATKLRPDYLPAYVNAAFAYNATGQNDKAEASFRKAIRIDSNSIPAHLNLAMLLGEQGRMREAEESFRNVLRIDPNSAAAAYNLGVILADNRLSEALDWCKRACEIRGDLPKYAYTYAFYLRQAGAVDRAAEILEDVIGRNARYVEAYFLLGEIYEQQEHYDKAKALYSTAIETLTLSPPQRYTLSEKIKRLNRK